MTPELTRRGFLGGTAAVAALLVLPFGLKREDLEERSSGSRFRLEPDETLVVLAELEDPKAGPKEVEAFGFLEDDGHDDSAPFLKYRIDPSSPSLSFVISSRWGVRIDAEPGVRVLAQAFKTPSETYVYEAPLGG